MAFVIVTRDYIISIRFVIAPLAHHSTHLACIYMTVFTITSNARSCVNYSTSHRLLTMYNNIYIDKYGFHCVPTILYEVLYRISFAVTHNILQ